MTQKKEILAALIGECMIELQEVQPGHTKQTFGGDTLNTAVYMARMRRYMPLRVDYVTALGTDMFSERMMAFWEKEGVGSDLVLRRQNDLPGLYYILLDDHGERRFSYWRSQAAAKRCFESEGSDRLLEKIGNYDLIYLSGISLAILTDLSRNRLLERLKELAATGKKIFFDYNFRPNLWQGLDHARNAYEKIISLCDTVFVGLDELEEMHGTHTKGSGHDFLAEKGVSESVIRSGAQSCSIMSRGEIVEAPPLPVEKVVDTTAAGDSFSGAYIAARMHGCDVRRAAEAAHRMAGYVIGHKGAIAPLEAMPDFADLLKR